MTHKSNVTKFALIAIFTLVFNTLSISTFAAISSSTITETKETQSSNVFSTIGKTLKHQFRSTKKVITKKAKQLKKEYNEMGAVKKVAWGIGMILIGALVTVGGVLSLSGWGFVLGLGLIIIGALKIVFGLLGAIF